jgi:putative redox protein
MATDTATIRVVHQGGDRLLMTVRGHEIRSDQPVADGGDDSAPTPTELFLASLAGCVTFYAERFLRRHELATDGLVVTCKYAWAANPTRIGEIDLTVEAPGLPPERLEAFSRVVEHCTVRNTLRQPPEVRIHVPSVKVVSVRLA